MPSMKNLIAESNSQELRRLELEQLKQEGDDSDDPQLMEHKTILNVIDTVSIKSISDAVILQLNWVKFDFLFPKERNGSIVNKVRQNIFSKLSFFQRNIQQVPRGPESKVDVSMLRSIMETNINDYLKKLPILAGMTHSQLETLVQMCCYKALPKGSVICKEGEEGDAVYLILAGEVKVESTISAQMLEMLKYRESTLPAAREPSARNKEQIASSTKRLTAIGTASQGAKQFLRIFDEDSDNESEKCTVELAVLKSGDYFGEMAAFVELPRSATCTSITNVLLVSLSKSDFHNLYHAIFSDLMPVIDSQVKRHMVQNIFDSKSPFLNLEGKNDAINRIADRSTIEKWPPGYVVFREGETADKFYFVYHGALKVEKMYKGVLRKLSVVYSGNYFGEMAIINNSSRAATITTTTDTVLLAIDAAYFKECFSDSPQLVTEFRMRMMGSKIDLRSALRYGETRILFANFLDKEHSLDNLHFIDDIDKFHSSCASMSAAEIYEEAQKIVRKYLEKSAPAALNVSHDVYERIRDIMSNPTMHGADMFAEAETEVLKLMEFDVFARFKKTEEFAALMDRLRYYTELDVITK